MGNSSGKDKASNDSNPNTFNAIQPIPPRNDQTQKERDKQKFEEEQKKPIIPIDDLCKQDIDPFFDNIGINGDKFMRQQHEIEFSDIAGYSDEEDSKYSVSSWRGSKDFVCCKIYKDKASKNSALLLWCRAVISSENESDKFIQVNLISLALKKKDNNEKYEFIPSDLSLYTLKKQIYIPLKNASANQQRFGVQLHPKRPFLFVFSRQSVNSGFTCLEFFNFEHNANKIRYDDENEHIIPNSVFSFNCDYYLNNECLEQNKLHFVTKKFGKNEHEYVCLFHKPEIEQNIQSGSKLIIFDLTSKNMNNFRAKQPKNTKYNSAYNQYGNANGNKGVSINFNSSIWSTLSVGRQYHHNLIDIYPRDANDENVLILFRIHHVNLINQNNAAAPPQSLAQLDPNSNFEFESWSQLYYVHLNVVKYTFSKIEEFGFKSMELSKTSVKESNCVDTVKFSEDGKFFAIIKQREHNNEALFRIYRTGESDKNEYLCQMTNIDIKPWMIQLRSHYSHKFGYFFSISHSHDDIEKAWMILAGPNIHGDLQTYRECLREFIYDDAISVIIDMIGLAHRYTLHFDIGYLAGEQMADFDYNSDLDVLFMAVDDASYLLFQTN